MGYDFMFIPLKANPNRDYPVTFDLLKEGDEGGQLPWEAFKTWLLSIGGSENGGPNSIHVDYGDDGSINFSTDGTSYISLDVHADWSRVHEAFVMMQQLDANCLLSDPQEGDFHDLNSFKRFWDSNASQ